MEIHAAPVKRYRHLFFDLDHTLWDFRTNSRAVLEELHAESGLGARDISCAAFVAAYETINAELWDKADRGELSKEALRSMRFRMTLERFGLRDNRLARSLDRDYMDRCPLRTTLMPGAREVLEDLRQDHRLHIITNGFTDVQGVKLAASGIRRYFDLVLTSEQAGSNKPSVRIFRHALRSVHAKAHESLMIGDSAHADVGGARKAGIDQVHFAPEGNSDPTATFKIARLDELRGILHAPHEEGLGPEVKRA